MYKIVYFILVPALSHPFLTPEILLDLDFPRNYFIFNHHQLSRLRQEFVAVSYRYYRNYNQ